MYNRNYGGFDFASTGSAQAGIHSELLKPALNRKLTHTNP